MSLSIISMAALTIPSASRPKSAQASATVPRGYDALAQIQKLCGADVKAAKAMILGIVKEPEVGEAVRRRGRRHQGLRRLREAHAGQGRPAPHLPRVANGRVGKVEDVLSLGDVVKVEVLEVDPKTGKISLDRLDKPDAPASASPAPRDKGERHERRERREDNRPGRAGRTPRRRHESGSSN